MCAYVLIVLVLWLLASIWTLTINRINSCMHSPSLIGFESGHMTGLEPAIAQLQSKHFISLRAPCYYRPSYTANNLLVDFPGAHLFV